MRRSGFTLIELVAALALTGMALMGAWTLLEQVGDNRDRVATAAARETRATNGVRLMRELVFATEAGEVAAERFSGTASSASFVTWCDAPGGWRVRCLVSLAVSLEADTSVVAVVRGQDAPVQLAWTEGTAILRYAERSGDSVVWVDRWIDGIMPPVAVALIGPRDTTVMGVGIAGVGR